MNKARTGVYAGLAHAALFGCACFALTSPMRPALADEATLAPRENIVTDGVPPIPATLAERVRRYSQARFAFQSDWHPTRREMIISTRFGNTYQAHLLTQPGGARTQLTFFTEPVYGGTYHPNGADYMLFQRDVGGGEWYQYFRYDFATGDSTLLTDGKSRNTSARWAKHGDQIAYMSSQRNGNDMDLWTMNPADPKSAHLLAQIEGGGWDPEDWSPDDKSIVALEGVSVNEAYLWLVDAKTGARTELTPRHIAEKVAYAEARFAQDGRGVYVTTDKDAEFLRLGYIDLATKKLRILTPDIKHDIDEFAVSWDGRTIAYLANEEGFSRLHLIDAASGAEKRVPDIPVGVMSGLFWHRNSRDLGVSLQTDHSPSDAYSLDVATGHVTRWSASETGVNLSSLPPARLIHWKSFDGREISAFLYPPAPRFTGKRPVIVDIHGGPEGEARPWFQEELNYYRNELGIAMLFPNVRGSTGFGKTFSKLDDGMLRQDSYRDINTLFDWIAAQPDLDAERVAVEGGSYGGFMTLSVAAFYPERIRCSIDVVGPSNLVTFLENTEAYRRDLRRVEYGDERDPKMREFLERIAPMNNVDKMKKPMLVVAGKNDPRVPLSESEQMVVALKKQNSPVWYLMAKDEGHGFYKQDNIEFYNFTTAAFIDQCLLK